MEKEVNNQLELFSQSKDNLGLNTNRKGRDSFVARIWGYEKTILVIIAVLITGIVSFSLGVEKGKRITANQPLIPKEAVVEAPLKLAEKSKQPVLVQQGPYTIQVASFKTKANAQQEAELLKRKGFTAVALNKGNYIILCVGNFSNKETAQPLLSQLSKYYRDCRIRRL